MAYSHTLSIDTGAAEYVRALVEFSYDGETVEIVSVTAIDDGGTVLMVDESQIDLDTLVTVAREARAESRAESIRSRDEY